jgi:MoxR-like ATPase
MNANSTDDSTIEFDCQFCRSRLRVPATLSQQSAKCPNCSKVLTVPAQDAAVPSPAAAPSTIENPAPTAATTPTPAASSRDDLPAEVAAVLLEDQDIAVHPLDDAPVKTESLIDQPHAPVVGDQTETRKLFEEICGEIEKVFVGQRELVEGTLVALFSGGHVLIESVPGLGKTLFVRTLGKILGCEFGRIQFTADLMPSDITGAPIFDMKTQEFRFRPGPVFTQLLLADEINRSPAKTHAALLEIMQERRVTVDGHSHQLKLPFLVVATQNPIESEGTYNLPEAQLDRFLFKLRADYPSEEQEAKILMMHGDQVDLTKKLEDEIRTVANPEKILKVTSESSKVRVEPVLVNYINRIVRLTRQWPQFYMGASPRAGIGLIQAARTLATFYGRDYAVPDDVVQLAIPTLRHRVMLTAEAEVEGQQVDDILRDLIRRVEVPRLERDR